MRLASSSFFFYFCVVHFVHVFIKRYIPQSIIPSSLGLSWLSYLYMHSYCQSHPNVLEARTQL